MNKIVKIVLISLAVLFFIPTIFTIIIYTNDVKKVKLLETGTETIGNVIDYKYVMTVNDIDYYSFEYEYFDKNGNRHTGCTESSFEFYYVINVDKITIFYDENFNSIEENFTYDTTKYLVLGIFSIIDFILWIVIISLIVVESTRKKIEKYGKEKTANFVDYQTNVYVNDTPLYSIKYSYVDSFGKTKETKSPSRYTIEVANYLRNKKTFAIKEFNGKSVITENLDLNVIDKFLNSSKIENGQESADYMFDDSIKKMKRCKYCQSLISIDETRCPYCNGSEFEEE